MKKTILLITALMISTVAISEEQLTSKNGHVILPEEGDFALGFDAVPVINFALNAVNIMNNTGHTAQHPGYVSGFNQVIVGKYFLSDDMAVRGRLGINTLTLRTKEFGQDPTDFDNEDDELLTSERVANNDFFFGGGIEFRRGHNRLQGFYGGEALIGLGANNRSVEYEFSYEDIEPAANESRILSEKSGTTVSLGLRGFAGVEYFFAPKMSIGAEFGWGFGWMNGPRGTVEVEFWDAADEESYVEESKGTTSSSMLGFSVDSGASQGFGGSAALTLNFHF